MEMCRKSLLNDDSVDIAVDWVVFELKGMDERVWGANLLAMQYYFIKWATSVLTFYFSIYFISQHFIISFNFLKMYWEKLFQARASLQMKKTLS